MNTPDDGREPDVPGLDRSAIVPGSELHIGEARLCITTYTTPYEKVPAGVASPRAS